MVYTVGNEQDYHFKVLFLILKKLGFDYDNRSDVYKNIQNLTLENTNDFFNKEEAES